MIIRTATKNDVRRINEIYAEGSIREQKLQFPNTSIKKIQREIDKYNKSRLKGFQKEMNLKNHHWIVAEKNNKILGFGNAWIKTEEIGVLEKIYIDLKWTRKGIGYQLLKELEKWLISKDVKFIEAGIYYKNKPSIKLNLKAGYKPISIKMRKEILLIKPDKEIIQTYFRRGLQDRC